MSGGFVQQGWNVGGDVKQAGRDFYDGQKNTRRKT
jgi:hypothetical protein